MWWLWDNSIDCVDLSAFRFILHFFFRFFSFLFNLFNYIYTCYYTPLQYVFSYYFVCVCVCMCFLLAYLFFVQMQQMHRRLLLFIWYFIEMITNPSTLFVHREWNHSGNEMLYWALSQIVNFCFKSTFDEIYWQIIRKSVVLTKQKC